MLQLKDRSTIIKDALDIVVENTPITNLNNGSIARSILEAAAPWYESLYELAKDIHEQGFLSKADAEHLPLIGQLFNYPRRMEVIINQDTGLQEEQLVDLETYRYEISKQVTAAVSSNETAVRLAALSVSGVQDIKTREYSHGTGSFLIIVEVQNGFVEDEVMSEVNQSIQAVKAFGNRAAVIQPDPVSLDMELQLIFPDTVTNEKQRQIRLDVERKLNTYFGNFTSGQPFIYNDFIQETMNTDENLVDFKIMRFSLSDEPVLLTNHEVLDQERIRPGFIQAV